MFVSAAASQSICLLSDEDDEERAELEALVEAVWSEIEEVVLADFEGARPLDARSAFREFVRNERDIVGLAEV